ncbi:MAG TPA: M48 family metallopeptidase [Bacteroidia bacterium]|nr:M48 family metallopeptidase [Bacteroidota bacterium]MBP6335884.1 M48 family metallopeptidase [Bacteroidia bacterium]MBP9791045.1 M48 family metallopeptidase [Bacteroidia bacterium]HQW23919.1 M48 family metallopeptidase [Bacteroidia bacterium]
MKSIKIKTLGLVLLLTACSKVPISNRKQLNLLPESEMVSMSLTSYQDFLKQNPPINGTPESQMVKNIGAKIQSAVITYLGQNKMGDRVAGYKWEFNLVNSKEVNAWCMPGGKVVVYSGILPLTQDEASLAVVMGHEIAHAVARHGNERMSQMLMQQMGGMALDVALSTKSAETKNMFMTAYGAGSNLGILAYSRTHETEADKLGLIFSAMAGYDPQKAITFWQRMAAQGGAKPPELLSTHPSDATRIKDLQAYMPTALKYYKPKN